MGRPIEYTEKKIEEIKGLFEKYIDETEIPIITEFAYRNNVLRQRLYEFEEISDTIKRCIDKKEAQLQRLALEGKINVTMAIFSLKQLGWKDRQEIEHAGGVEVVLQPAVINKPKEAGRGNGSG